MRSGPRLREDARGEVDAQLGGVMLHDSNGHASQALALACWHRRQQGNELPALAAEITAGTLTINPTSVPLSDVETTWNARVGDGTRIVFTP